MTVRILFFLLITALFGSCSSSGKVTADTDKSIVFGNGGGFTGQYTTYKLNTDGRIYLLHADSSQQQIKKLRKKQTSEIFSHADKIRNTLPEFSHPYNLTWFIRYYSEGQSLIYEWGDPAFPVATEIKDLYTQLNSSIK